MSGGHFYVLPSQVGDEYCGQWQDAELDALLFDLFGAGWDGWRGPYGIGKPRKNEFGRIWHGDPEYSGGLAETLDLYLSGDIDEDEYREQVARFKAKWFRRTPRNRIEFYRQEFTEAATALMEQMREQLGEA